MGWVFLEILAALAIAVGIVWWTIPKGSGKAKGTEDGKAGGDDTR